VADIPRSSDATRRILVIEGDEGFSRALGRGLQGKGFFVEVQRQAQIGFRRASGSSWDCIVCSPDLPDIDGVWVARRIRTEASKIAKVPILFVGPLADGTIRSQALGVGVDVFIARPPATVDDVVAQVGALIAMRHRLDGEDNGPPSVSMTAAVRGDLSAFPLASLLMMFEMERQSGTVTVVAQSGKRCVLTITSGLFATTESGGVPRPPLDVLREVLSWRAGHFSFHPRETGALPAPRASVGALVLEAMRLEDEAKGPAPIKELDPDDIVLERTRSSIIPINDEHSVPIRTGSQPPRPKGSSIPPRPSAVPPRPSAVPPRPSAVPPRPSAVPPRPKAPSVPPRPKAKAAE
jgi:CheY-like chemotaxis protein